jgi:predicted NBD/HSP70 family sugar kinase
LADTARSVDRRLAPHTQSDVRRRNLWLVLQNIRAAGTTTRVRIARETGLTGTTVHRLTDELERRALVRQVAPDVRAGVGRPPLMFCFDGRIGHVAGIDVGNETTRAALADLNGKELTRAIVPTASIEGNLPLALEQMVGDLQRREMLPRDRLVAIGVGVAAVTGAEGTIIRASMHHLWEGLQLGLELRRQMGCEVVVSQDDHLAALAELEVGGCVGLRDAIVVNIGKGVGVGIITDGAIHPGAHGAAGRVGWIPAPQWAADDGSAAREARLVPLANLLTADGLIADFIRFGGTGEMDGARAVFAAAESGDVAADRAVDTFADRLGWVIGTAVALFDPQRVVVGGGISGSFDRLAAPVAARVAAIVAVPPPIVASTLGTGAVVSGAIASAARLADGWLSTRLNG